jgi:hypothetical protein
MLCGPFVRVQLCTISLPTRAPMRSDNPLAHICVSCIIVSGLTHSHIVLALCAVHACVRVMSRVSLRAERANGQGADGPREAEAGRGSRD